MDEITAPDRTITARARTPASDDGSAAPDQLPLPTFDDGADEPIGYLLTARARREVAPETVPALRVVPSPHVDDDLDRADDTRPSRARALRRAGAGLDEIAAELGVDGFVVQAWVGDVGPRSDGLVARAPRRGSAALGQPRSEHAEREDGGRSSSEDRRASFELARAAARDEAPTRLRDPAVAAGVGVVSAILTADEHGATLVTRDLDVAALALGFLERHAGAQLARLRVVLRLGPDVAGDLARHRTATRLGLTVDRVLHTRWRGAPAGDASEVMIRVPDPAIAALLAGWRDALIAAPDGTDLRDAGF